MGDMRVFALGGTCEAWPLLWTCHIKYNRPYPLSLIACWRSANEWELGIGKKARLSPKSMVLRRAFNEINGTGQHMISWSETRNTTRHDLLLPNIFQWDGARLLWKPTGRDKTEYPAESCPVLSRYQRDNPVLSKTGFYDKTNIKWRTLFWLRWLIETGREKTVSIL